MVGNVVILYHVSAEPDFGADSISLAPDMGTYSRAGSVMGEMTDTTRSLMLGHTNSMILGTSASMLDGGNGYSRAGSVMGGTLEGEDYYLSFYHCLLLILCHLARCQGLTQE